MNRFHIYTSSNKEEWVEKQTGNICAGYTLKLVLCASEEIQLIHYYIDTTSWLL
jgi:hypothetical protein